MIVIVGMLVPTPASADEEPVVEYVHDVNDWLNATVAGVQACASGPLPTTPDEATAWVIGVADCVNTTAKPPPTPCVAPPVPPCKSLFTITTLPGLLGEVDFRPQTRTAVWFVPMALGVPDGNGWIMVEMMHTQFCVSGMYACG